MSNTELDRQVAVEVFGLDLSKLSPEGDAPPYSRGYAFNVEVLNWLHRNGYTVAMMSDSQSATVAAFKKLLSGRISQTYQKCDEPDNRRHMTALCLAALAVAREKKLGEGKETK